MLTYEQLYRLLSTNDYLKLRSGSTICLDYNADIRYCTVENGQIIATQGIIRPIVAIQFEFV